MKRSRKSMLLSSLAMLMVSTIALSTATYAWFTSGNTAKVGAFDFTAQTASGIQISADGSAWGSSLSLANLNVASLKNKFPNETANGKWEPVSSAGEVDSGKLKLFTATLGEGTISSAAITENLEDTAQDATQTYIRFNFFVKNDGQSSVPFSLDFTDGNTSSVTAGDDDTLNKGIQNAVRIAIIEQGHKTVGSSTVLTPAAHSAWIWEPNAAAHANTAWGTTAQKTFGIKAATTEAETSVDNMFGSTSANVKEQNEAAGFHQVTSKTKITDLSANSITMFTAYIWLEGQDVDCTNFESGGKVVVNLAFSGAESLN